MGHSAGAHLVSLVGVDARYLEGEGLSLQALKGIIALDTQAYNLPALLTTQSGVEGGIYDRAFGKDPQTWELLSPARYIEHRGSFPPFLVAYSGAAGDRANQSINFVEALEAAGAYAELLPAPDKTHSQINRQIGEPGDAVTQAIFQFLTTMLAED
jgi:acetyl esterase/lipase